MKDRENDSAEEDARACASAELNRGIVTIPVREGHREHLDYEPRSMAVSEDGEKVALGLKSGDIRMWARQPKVGWEPKTLRKRGKGAKSVRVLVFNAEGNRLAFAEQGGGVGMFALDSRGASWELVESNGNGDGSHSEDEEGARSALDWCERPRRGIHLDEDVFLVLDENGAGTLLRGGPPSSARSVKVEEWGKCGETRLCGLVASTKRDRWWALELDGSILEFGNLELDEESDKVLLGDRKGRVSLTSGSWIRSQFQGDQEFRSLKFCEAGLLAVLRRHVVFIPFKSRFGGEGSGQPGPEVGSGAREANGTLDEGRALWLATPFVVEAAVVCPRAGGDEDEVWVAIATAEKGVMWLALEKDEKSGRWKPGAGDSWSWFGPALFGPESGKAQRQTGALEVALRPRDGGAYLYVADRGHRLAITPVLAIRSALDPDGSFEEIGREHVADLAHRLFVKANGSLRSARETRSELVEEFETRVADLLERSWKLGPDAVQAVARTTTDRIFLARREKSITWRELAAFGGFVRKWIVNGRTFGDKSVGLAKLSSINETAGNKLDALAYQLPLIFRRADRTWVSLMPRGDTILDVAVGRDFVVASYASGQLRAFGREEGKRLAWELSSSASKEKVQLCDEGMGLVRSGCSASIGVRNGAYARHVYMQSLDSSGHSWFVCCFKEDDDSQATPLFFCAVLKKENNSVRVCEIETAESHSEIYGLTGRTSEEGNSFRLEVAAGTNGRWEEEGNAGRRPFTIFCLSWDPTEQVLSRESSPGEEGFKGYEARGAREEDAIARDFNPCWSLVFSDAATLWAGFHDGMIRKFVRKSVRTDSESESDSRQQWQEVGADDRGRAPGVLDAGSPVHQLDYRSLGAGGAEVAYGTADGVGGVVRLPPESTGEPTSRLHIVGHVVHVREDAPISGVTWFEDGEDRVLFLAEDGTAAIFCLGEGKRSEREALEDRTDPHPTLPGMRLDRFRFDHGSRALKLDPHWSGPTRPDGRPTSLASCSTSRGRGAPQFIVAADDGRLHSYSLLYPRRTKGRTDVVSVVKDLASEELKGGVAGMKEDLAHRYLRLLDLGHSSFARFSAWMQLQDEGLRGDVSKFEVKLDELRRELYGRAPLDRDVAQVLWEQAARLSNERVKKWLEERPEGAAHLRDALSLDRKVASLCNQWIHHEEETEAQVLIDSLSHLIDWPDLKALAIWVEEASPDLAGFRENLVQEVLRRRLLHSNARVQFEALRVLNRALLQLNAQRAKQKPEAREALAIWPHGKGPGFADLLAMVGDIGRSARPRPDAAKPLATELARFFAVSLHVFQGYAYWICAMLSENLMAAEGSNLSDLVREQYRLNFPGAATAGSAGDRSSLRYFESFMNTDLEEHVSFLGWPHVENEEIEDALRKKLEDAFQKVNDALTTAKLNEALTTAKPRTAVPYVNAEKALVVRGSLQERDSRVFEGEAMEDWSIEPGCESDLSEGFGSLRMSKGGSNEKALLFEIHVGNEGIGNLVLRGDDLCEKVLALEEGERGRWSNLVLSQIGKALDPPSCYWKLPTWYLNERVYKDWSNIRERLEEVKKLDGKSESGELKPGAFYAHSASYLNDYLLGLHGLLVWLVTSRPLCVYRDDVKTELGNLGATKLIELFKADESFTETTEMEPTRVALKFCEIEDRALRTGMRDLFEPQVSIFRKIIGGWRDEIHRQVGHAEVLLSRLEAFNRHSYRSSADQLLASVTELAFQHAPFLPGVEGRGSIRTELRKGLRQEPLIYEVYESALQMVSSSQLSGALLAVAASKAATLNLGSCPLNRVMKIFEEEGRLEGLEVEPQKELPEGTPLPGSESVWRTIAHELARNIRRYASGGNVDRMFVGYSQAGQAGQAGQENILFVQGEKPLEECWSGDTETKWERWLNLKELKGRAETSPDSGGSGLGLSLLKLICYYSTMRFEIDLHPFGRWPSNSSDDSEDLSLEQKQERLGNPLTSIMKWQ